MKSYFRVKDYCHYSGNYRGAAHSNLKYNISNKIRLICERFFTLD